MPLQRGTEVTESYVDRAGKISTSFELVLIGSNCRCFKGETESWGRGGGVVVRGYKSRKPMFLTVAHLRQNSLKNQLWGLPGDPVIKNHPANAGETGSSPGRGTKIPHAAEQLSP